jgi:pimeloyl-ACP methyl ester carboxylesterase
MIIKTLRIIILVSAIISCSGEATAQVDRMVDIGSHRLHMHVEGEGSVAVIIDVGLGDQSNNWRTVLTRIAQVARVVTYDRAGYGQSEMGPLPRSSERVAEELKKLLEAASIPGPYILVGHSLGGLNMQVYAGKYPADAAGMVLLDPPPLSWLLDDSYPELKAMAEQMTEQWETAADQMEQSENEADKAQAMFLRIVASEHREMFGSSAKAGAAITNFGDIPLIVIASGRTNPMFGDVAEEYQAFWVEQSRVLASKSSRGKFLLLEESSHNIYADEPEQVIEAILSLVTACGEQQKQ